MIYIESGRAKLPLSLGFAGCPMLDIKPIFSRTEYQFCDTMI